MLDKKQLIYECQECGYKYDWNITICRNCGGLKFKRLDKVEEEDELSNGKRKNRTEY